MTDIPKEVRDRAEAFEDEWKWQIGSLMLKEENQGLEWKKAVAQHFWNVATQSRDEEVARLREALEGVIEHADESTRRNLDFDGAHAVDIARQALTRSTGGKERG